MVFVSQLINGLQLGSIYALVALGYTMVYGIIKLLNFAHGDVIMVGGYIALNALSFGWHPVVAALATVLGCMILAVVMEKLAYRPIRFAPRLSLLITAIGLSILLQNLAQLIFSASPQFFPTRDLFPFITDDTTSLQIGELQIGYVPLITILVSLVSMVALTILVQKTKLGKAMRAVSEDTGAAQLMGINVNTIITFTFAIGAALAGIGALLYGAGYPRIEPTLGVMLGLKAFVAAVVGGIGSIPGAMIGGFAIGLLEVLVKSIGWSGWVDGAVFLILIIVLLVKPSGIMGRNLMEKV
ncbi:MAG: branched-chain amino acid ABC transporter permease [Oscillospiraceae bacterium]|nr:branched-chain amino acid ABC transporter permease [Oscillospiraceae bacterium]